MACNCGKNPVKKTDARQITKKTTPMAKSPSIRRVIKRPAK